MIAFPQALELDAGAEIERICASLRRLVATVLDRRGAVIGLSGGIDSSVCAALCVRALGPQRVLGLCMPEKESSSDSLQLAGQLAEGLGIPTVVEDISGLLEASGCYRRRDDAIRSVVPAYGEGYECKIVLPAIGQQAGYAISSLVVRSPSGVESRHRLTAPAYRAIVAATNFKQRCRKMLEYHYADCRHFAVIGTPNRLEYDQGFFVKNGDGAADIKPIAHLYKCQVYQLARALAVPEEIQRRPPTTDTFSMQQSQEEFYFSVPLEQMDRCLYGVDRGVSPEALARAAGLAVEQVREIYRQIALRRRATRYLHMPPSLCEEPAVNGRSAARVAPVGADRVSDVGVH